MDVQAKRKALFRAKLNAQKQEKQRIDSPLIRYDEHDQPVCRVCDVVIKSESLWPAHQASRKHHEAIDKLKASAAALNRVRSSKPEPRQELTKSNPESHGELHDKSKPSAALPKNRPSIPPPGFFDNHEPKRQKNERDSGKLRDCDSHKESVAANAQIVEPFVPASGIDNVSAMALYGSEHDPEFQSSKDLRQGLKIAVGIENKQVRGALPEGFFDDKDSDLRARGITPVKPDVNLDDTVGSGNSKNFSTQARNTDKKCSKITFQSVRELSLGGDKLNGSSFVDMDKALKGLVSSEPHGLSAQLVDSVDNIGQVMQKSCCSEFHVPGDNIPLDLTLKTTMRILSTSSVNWFHRLTNCGTSNGLSQFTSVGCTSQSTGCTSEPTSNCQSTNSRTSHSWVHPQSILPRSVIAALTTAPGGQMDFLSNRQQAWEDSFRCLYYMLRKKTCKIFYVCTEQFVVMFVGLRSPKETKSSYLAYVSQSTTNLRSLLKEHGASFSMPLSHSKVEEAAAEDLVELSEMEKYNLGQARAMETMTGIDNSPQSLLMFTGNKGIHALYDFLLNYRFFLTSITGGDVPVLYSPVAFENAALSAPVVRCRQLRKADYVSLQRKDSDMDSAPYSDSSSGICYSIEINDVYLPPWAISGICNAMHSNGVDFQASFVTESTSIGLNIGLGIAKDQSAQQAVADEPLRECSHPFDIPYATLSPHTQNAFLKGLKYSGGSYTASVSPVM